MKKKLSLQSQQTFPITHFYTFGISFDLNSEQFTQMSNLIGLKN